MIFTECGILLQVNNKLTNLKEFLNKLKKLQHRGRESCGVVYYDGFLDYFKQEKTLGIINNLDEKTKELNINSELFLGHVRYATSGSKNNSKLIQPQLLNIEINNSIKNKLEIEIEQLCYAYNGNIPDKVWYKINKELNFIQNESIKKTNDNILLREFINYCLKFKLHSLLKTVNIDILNNLDFELLDKLIKFVSKNILKYIDTSFCLIILTINKIYCLRDKYGNRPLFYNLEENNLVITSETCISDENIHWNIVNPGELLIFEISNLQEYTSEFPNKIFLSRKNSVNSVNSVNSIDSCNNKEITYDNSLQDIEDINPQRFCLFEKIYFMNKNSILDNRETVQQYREKLSLLLINQIKYTYPIVYQEYFNTQKLEESKYIICGVPSTGLEYSNKIAQILNIPSKNIITKNKNTYRSFICGNDEDRIKACKQKFEIDGTQIYNQNLIVVDDSIVRGNTLFYLIKILKQYKPKSIHLLIPSPPVRYKCYYGVDISTEEELIFNKYYNKHHLDFKKNNKNNNINIKLSDKDEEIIYNKTIVDIKNKFEVEQLIYLDYKSILSNDKKVCSHCFSGIDILNY